LTQTLSAEDQIQQAYVDGATLSLHGEESERQVRGEFLSELLRGALLPPAHGVEPRINVEGAHILGPLSLAGADLDTRLQFKNCVFESPLDLSDTTVRSLRLPGCTVPGIEAAGIHVRGNLELNRGFVARGRVSLVGGHVEGDLRLADATLSHSPDLRDEDSPKDVALAASRLRVGGALLARRLEVTGQIRMISARIGGLFSLAGAKLRHPGSIALHCERIEVGESVFFQGGFEAHGRVFFQNATIGGGVDGLRSVFSDPGQTKPCLQLVRARIGRNVSLVDAELHNNVSLRGARLEGAVLMSGCRFVGDGLKLLASQLAASHLDFRWAAPPAELDLRNATVGLLEDDSAAWPEVVRLGGATYGRLHSATSVDSIKRVEWLARDPDQYAPQPYDQLASVYRSAGDDPAARNVMLQKQRARRRTLGPAGRLVGFVQDCVVGYGYRNWLAALWLAPLLVIGTIVFTASPPSPVSEGRSFNALLFTMDLLVPVVGLGQRDHFAPTGATQWFAGLLVVVGWVLTTALAAGVARSLSRS
jgi:hypothetical protein